MKITLLAHHIEWDTDGDMDAARGLPSKVAVEVDLDAVECLFPVSINDQICNQLSNITGWCVLDYKLEGYSAEADYARKISCIPNPVLAEAGIISSSSQPITRV